MTPSPLLPDKIRPPLPDEIQMLVADFTAYTDRNALAAVSRGWAQAVGLALQQRTAADAVRWWGCTPERNPLRYLPIRRLNVEVSTPWTTEDIAAFSDPAAHWYWDGARLEALCVLTYGKALNQSPPTEYWCALWRCIDVTIIVFI